MAEGTRLAEHRHAIEDDLTKKFNVQIKGSFDELRDEIRELVRGVNERSESEMALLIDSINGLNLYQHQLRQQQAEMRRVRFSVVERPVESRIASIRPLLSRWKVIIPLTFLLMSNNLRIRLLDWLESIFRSLKVAKCVDGCIDVVNPLKLMGQRP
ncbi:hypothetical protein Droror1_Dr00025130 [Drosera rotundifolia]